VILEYFHAKVQHYANKLVTDKVVESKMELQELFVQVAKCNSTELASLAREILDVKEMTKNQHALIIEANSNFKVLESQIKVLELGIAQHGQEDQPVVFEVN
jgi:hypothetical protein